MLRILAIFAFFAVHNVLGAVDYRISRSVRDDTNATTNKTEMCQAPGFVCSPDNCQDIYACMSMSGGYKPILTRKCPDDQTCLNGNCTSGPNPRCSGVMNEKFVCNSIGMFPDPFDCKKYHMCCPDANNAVGTGSPVTCPKNYGYNPRTMFCDKKLTNNTCGVEYPVPICTYYGQTAALKENPSIFYLCLPGTTAGVIYPNLYACDNGGIYDNKNLSCK